MKIITCRICDMNTVYTPGRMCATCECLYADQTPRECVGCSKTFFSSYRQDCLCKRCLGGRGFQTDAGSKGVRTYSSPDDMFKLENCQRIHMTQPPAPISPLDDVLSIKESMKVDPDSINEWKSASNILQGLVDKRKSFKKSRREERLDKRLGRGSYAHTE